MRVMDKDDPINVATPDLLKAGFSLEDTYVMSEMWEEPHRAYHGKNHLRHIFSLIESDPSTSAEEKSLLRVLAVIHDIVNNPRFKDNEEQSAEFYKVRSGTRFNQVLYNAVLDTKDHTQKPSSKLSETFIGYDLHNLLHGSLAQMIEDSKLVMREYGFHDWQWMKAGRLAFMKGIEPFIKSKSSDSHISEYIDWLEQYQPRIAAFAGSFFPMHKGHVDILHKAERIFDKVIVACGQNPDKPYTAEDIKTNVEQIQKMLPNNQVEFFPDFLPMYIAEKPYPITIVKGLRNPSDFDAEKLLLRYMEDMMPEIDITYIISDRKYEHVSSSGVKMIRRVEGKLGIDGKYSNNYLKQ